MAMLDVSGTRVTETDLNPANRTVETRVTVNGDTATDTFEYYTTPGRYDNGALRSAKLKKAFYSDGSWETFEYNATSGSDTTGWLSRKTRPVAGNGSCLTNETLYGYTTPMGGDAPLASALLELPRSIESYTAGQLVGKTLYSYSGYDEGDRRVTTRQYHENNKWTTNITGYGPFQCWYHDHLSFDELSAVWDWDLRWGYLKTGLPGHSTGPLNDIDITQTITNGVLITTNLNWTTEEKAVQVVNAFGNAVSNIAWRRNNSTSAYVKVDSSIAANADSFGRSGRTDFFNGTWVGYSNYDLYGPTTVREIDGSRTTRDLLRNPRDRP